jgi:2-polyprenyl-6-methoxyphenol hydroxylase-like FAD-dependent oxidoreductase
MSPGAGKKALVIGGSVAGLAAALLLRRAGWDVHVFERTEGDQSRRGAGIVTHPQLFAALERLGVPAASIPGPRFTRRVMLDVAGRRTHEIDYPQLGTAWAAVYAALFRAFGSEGYHAEAEFAGFSEDAAGVVARFADGSTVRGDILVGADGLRSAVRRTIFPDVTPLYVGYVTWRGIVPHDAEPARRHTELFDEFCFCLPEGEQIAGYPICHGDFGRERACNFVWYRPADQTTLDDFLTDETGRHHPLGIPPPLVRSVHIDAMRRDACSRLSPQFSDLIASIERPFFQAIYDLEVPAMHSGRVALIGDAAFVARPHVGAGVTKALEDAVALADGLAGAESIPDALGTFDARRHSEGRRIVAMARKLGAYMQAERRTEQEKRDAAAYRDPLAVLSDHASLRFLARPEGAPADASARR